MKGFQNIGNTCYLNAGLQMLVRNKELCNIILKYSSHSPILNIIGEFIVEYYNDDNSSIAPHTIKKIVEERKDLFIGYQQQDSTEFIVFFLDVIDMEIKKINNIEEVQNLFGVKINTRTKCKIKSCLTISNKLEFNNFIMLDLNHEMKSLDDAYREFKSGEKLEGDEKYYCANCKAKRIASKRYNVEEWPHHIVVWLKRFKQVGNSITKMNQHLDIPLDWRYNMKLEGAVIHYGGLHGGHYVYVGKHIDKWYLFDDSNVAEIPNENKLKDILQFAYCLYYKI